MNSTLESGLFHEKRDKHDERIDEKRLIEVRYRSQTTENFLGQEGKGEWSVCSDVRRGL